MPWLERLYIDLPAARPGSAGAYGVACGLATVATAARLGVDPVVEGVQYITFFPAVIVTTLVSGMRAGFVCVSLSALAAWFFILPPKWAINVTDWQQVTTVAFFVLVAGADVLFIGTMRLAIQRYRELTGTLEARVAQRTAALVRTQQALAQSQKMEAIGQLTGGVAHDFNNMIAVVVGNLDLMRRRLAAGRTDVTRHLENAMEGAERATRLTQRLLAFARHQPLAPAIIDANQLVRDMSELLRRTLGETIKLECVTAAGLWRTHVDPGQLESAIVNLAVNARDAMPAGGALTIETANAELDDAYAAAHEDVAPGHYVMIAVSDTGVGMSPEVAGRAIDPFFTTKATGKGTGLGLSQVYGFVKQSKGHLAIYSEEGRGTTVRLYLPRAHGAVASAPLRQEAPAAEPPEPAAKPVILLVEDEEHVRRTSAATLAELGYPVREAASGAEALALLDEDPTIAVMFTDVVMPGMDGRRLSLAAKRKRPDLKVLYTTGYTRNAIVHDGTLDPDVALIAKPFTLDQLARALRAVIDGRGAERTSAPAADD